MLEVDAWWVRLWDYPRLQIAALLLIAIVAQLLLGSRRGWRFWTLTVAAVVALGWQARLIADYLPGAPKQVASVADCPAGRSLSLLNANVLLDNRKYDRLIALVRRHRPDVVLLLEPGPEWEAAIRVLHPLYPFRIGEAVPNTYGMILLSRLPMMAEVRHLMQPAIPSIRASLQLASGERIDLHALHPEPPLPGDDSGERDAELLIVGREVRGAARAALVMGDLNDVGWSRTSRLFRELAGMRDPRVGRGPYPTFPAGYPLLRWPLDHLFVTEHFALQRISRLDDIGSDHLPMLFRVCLARPPGQRLTAPRAAPEVREEVREEVAAGRQERVAEERE